MLTVNGRTYSRNDFIAATQPVAGLMGKTAPKEGTVQRGLLTSLVSLAASDEAAFDVREVLDVYNQLIDQATAQVPVTAAARAWCQGRLGTPLASELRTQGERQAQTLAELKAHGTVVITRGTDPNQAQDILTNTTFGGLVHDPAIVGAPEPGDADKQTGLGIKNTAAGRIEEWSLGSLAGFASNGFMLIAEARVSDVTLPVSDFAVNAGEAGVCGYAAARLVRVAILGEGRQVDDDPLQPELEKIKKGIGTKRIDALAQLKAAAHRLRGVAL